MSKVSRTSSNRGSGLSSLGTKSSKETKLGKQAKQV